MGNKASSVWFFFNSFATCYLRETQQSSCNVFHLRFLGSGFSDQAVSWFLKRLCDRSHCIDHGGLLYEIVSDHKGTLLPSFDIHINNNMDERAAKATLHFSPMLPLLSAAVPRRHLQRPQENSGKPFCCVRNTFAWAEPRSEAQINARLCCSATQAGVICCLKWDNGHKLTHWRPHVLTWQCEFM